MTVSVEEKGVTVSNRYSGEDSGTADRHGLFYKTRQMLRAILIFSILGGGLIAALYSRFAALLLYLWFALFRPQEFLWFDISGWQLSLWIGVLLIVSCSVTGTFPNATHPISIGTILFLFAAFVAQANAVDPVMGWMWLDYLFRLILVSLLATTLISTRRRFVWTVGVIAGSFGFYSAKAGLASLLGGGVRFFDGLAGAFIDNNSYAVGTAMVMPLLIATAQNLPREGVIQKFIRAGFFAAVPLSAMLIISTFSRAGFLALIATTLAFILLQRGRWLFLSVTIVTLAIVVPFIPLPHGYVERLDTIRTYEEVGEDSALGRLHFWRVAIDMAQANPFGVGLRNFESAYDRYDFLNGTFGRRRAVHNSHLQVLTETGFFGLFAYLSLFGYSLIAAWRIRKHALAGAFSLESHRFFYTASNALIASMAGFLIGGAFISLALNDITWLSFALVASLDRLARQQRLPLTPDVDQHVAGAPEIEVPLTQPAALGSQG